jgi:hypothetical protein
MKKLQSNQSKLVGKFLCNNVIDLAISLCSGKRSICLSIEEFQNMAKSELSCCHADAFIAASWSCVLFKIFVLLNLILIFFKVGLPDF